MILIDRKKVKEAKNDIYYMGHVSSSATEQIYLCNCASFDSGVAFAEKELQNLAIEFADWITTSECSFAPIGENVNEWVDLSKEGITIIISSKELFEEFLKQRKTV